MLAAGLLARKAVARASPAAVVKTSLAPGSQVVTDHLKKAGVQDDLTTLGFNVVGYGCTTCIGNPARCRRNRRASPKRTRRRRGAQAATATSRPRASGREGELPRLAAAGGRLRHRRARSTST